MSTKTGLVYIYVQDTTVSPDGQYDWYMVAIVWATGAVVWQFLVGSGGTFNDNWLPASLGPDGQLYQAVFSGIFSVKDGI